MSNPTGDALRSYYQDLLMDAAEAGWNACRRQVYLLAEDYTERTHTLAGTDTVEGNFYRGQYDVAKSFAKAFNAFEARDCSYFKQIDFAKIESQTSSPAGSQIRTAQCDGKDAVPETGQLSVGTASTPLTATPEMIAGRLGHRAFQEGRKARSRPGIRRSHQRSTQEDAGATPMSNPTGDALKASAAQVRHKKRGSTYDVIGVGKMQSEMWEERTEGTVDRAGYPEPVDMREVVVYRSTDDGSLWVRPREEFEDGRFEPAISPPVEQAPQPVATDVAWKDGFIVGQAQPGMDAHWVWMQRRDAFRATPTEAPPVEQSQAATWMEVPKEPPLELLESINAENPVLAYENGRYYNAWFTFEVSEGGWFWTDDADSEPNPSHYMRLPAPPALASEGSAE